MGSDVRTCDFSTTVRCPLIVFRRHDDTILDSKKGIDFEEDMTSSITVSSSILTAKAPDIDHLDRHGYLFGYPISHSLAPLLFRTIFRSLDLNWDYLPLSSTDIDQLLRLIRHSRCYGTCKVPLVRPANYTNHQQAPL